MEFCKVNRHSSLKSRISSSYKAADCDYIYRPHRCSFEMASLLTPPPILVFLFFFFMKKKTVFPVIAFSFRLFPATPFV